MFPHLDPLSLHRPHRLIIRRTVGQWVAVAHTSLPPQSEMKALLSLLRSPHTRPAITSTASTCVAAGWGASTLGQAFLSAYQEANKVGYYNAHTPSSSSSSLPAPQLAFCATERAKGAPTFSIQAEFCAETNTVSGHKTFVTGGPEAEVLGVVAVNPEVEDEGEGTCVVLVDARKGDGIQYLAPEREIDFLPDVSHSQILLDAAPVLDVVCDRDAFRRIVRPFRMIEDSAVALATNAYIASRLDRDTLAKLLPQVVSAFDIYGRILDTWEALPDPEDRIMTKEALVQESLLYASAASASSKLVRTALDLGSLGPDFARDSPIFQVAQGARNARTKKAVRFATTPH